MNFHRLLQQHATAAPRRIALIDDGQPWSYSELTAEAERIAGLLHDAGARPGQRLALWMPNCVQWLVVFLGCARLGVTVVAVNTRFRENEVRQLLELGQCSWLAVWPEFKGLPFAEILAALDTPLLSRLQGILGVGALAALRERLPNARVLDYNQAVATDALNGVPPADEQAPALVYTTSGTTSLPKLVLHRQAGLIAHGATAARAYGIVSDSVVLLAAPLCGAFGFSTAVSGLAAGATLVSSAVFDAARTVQQVLNHGVTHTFANNELIDLLLRAAGTSAQPFPLLQYVGFASFAPALDDLQERARASGIPIAGLYGSSELQALVAGHRLETPWEHRRLAGGTLVAPEARVRAVDAETGRTLPHGETGLLEICAPSLMTEYLGNAEATAQATTADGYFRTGDLAFTLDERSFVFQGRRGDYLRLGGFLVNPMEIEQFIERQEGVKACQVVGAEFQGKLVPVAFAIPEPGVRIDEAAVLARCRNAMARFKVPQRLVEVDAFPVVKSANSNKIQRSRLQQIAAELLSALP